MERSFLISPQAGQAAAEISLMVTHSLCTH
jgi:hypothetical protein